MGIILKTTDGGTNWIKQFSLTNANFSSVVFPDPNHGWVVGERLIGGNNAGDNLKNIGWGKHWITAEK